MDILFVSRKSNRGGALYENMVKDELTKTHELEPLELDPTKNKLLYFNKLKYFYQIRHYKAKSDGILITNKAGLYGGVLALKPKRKILILHHHVKNEINYPIIRSILNKQFINKLNQFDKIVVVAQYWKNFFSNYVEAKKIKVIYNSFDVDRIQHAKKALEKEQFFKHYNIPNNKIIVYAGNALKTKGFLEVLQKLNSNKFFVITSGQINTSVKHLHLRLDYSDYIKLLTASDVTVLLSNVNEGWNRIAHESLLCETPVIGNDLGGLGELLDNAGQNKYNMDKGLDQQIFEVINNKEIIRKGYDFAHHFDLNYFRQEWEKLVDN